VNLRLGKQENLPDDVHTVGAEWSECGRYRYALWRIWGEPGEAAAAFIGMNPSSADEHHDDATARKCGQYARRWGYAGMLMLNLWAIRGTDPEEALRGDVDPVGPENNGWIVAYAEDGCLTYPDEAMATPVGEHPIGLFVAAWGTRGTMNDRGEHVAKRIAHWQDIYCLGTTKHGHPKHPARLANDKEPVLYRNKAEGAA